MITIAKYTGFFLLILVGYHYINEPIGFSIAGSIATVIFAGCLIEIYQGYKPDIKNWFGWILITSGCLILASFSSFRLLLFIPVIIIVVGYRFAELPFHLHSVDSDGGDFGGCGGDGGGD